MSASTAVVPTVHSSPPELQALLTVSVTGPTATTIPTQARTTLSTPATFHCTFCGSPALRPAFTYPDRDGHGVEIHLCPVCSCLIPRFDGGPTAASKLEFQTAFHDLQWPELSPTDALQLAAGCQSMVTYYARWLHPAGGRVIELGAGRGGLLAAFRSSGYEVSGCEPSAHLVDLARQAFGLDAQTLHCRPAEEYLETVAQSKARVQAVFLWHVIEHVHLPLALLRQASSVLCEGGYLIAQVPLLNQEQIHPAHLFFMGEEAVQHIARTCDLELVETNYDLDRKFLAFILAKPATSIRDRDPVASGLPTAEGPSPALPAEAAPSPNGDGSRLNTALSAWNRGDWSACEAALASILTQHPNHPAALQLLGSLRLQEGRVGEATHLFDRLLEGHPDHVPALLGLARCDYEQGDLMAARLGCLRALKLDPTNLIATQNLEIIAARAALPRSLRFTRHPHRRFFWHKMPNSGFVPPIYSFLEDSEWSLLNAWFEDTETRGLIGESTVPFMSLLQGLIMGNRLRRIVQLGTYSGYSTLLIGFMLRRMGIECGLLSADVDAPSTEFAREYVRRARLDDQVKLVLSDSKCPSLVRDTRDYFKGFRPQLAIVDSSHERDQTLVELDLWYDALTPGGFLVLHDSSAFAQQWDVTNKGGVKSAFEDWTAQNPNIPCLNIDCAAAVDPASPHFVYQDGNGVGLIYKRDDR